MWHWNRYLVLQLYGDYHGLFPLIFRLVFFFWGSWALISDYGYDKQVTWYTSLPKSTIKNSLKSPFPYLFCVRHISRSITIRLRAYLLFYPTLTTSPIWSSTTLVFMLAPAWAWPCPGHANMTQTTRSLLLWFYMTRPPRFDFGHKTRFDSR